MPALLSIEERFWSKVNKHGSFPKKYTKVKTRCWLWTAGTFTNGYGVFLVYKGKTVRAHRFACELLKGIDYLGTDNGCHKCDNILCVRPSHIFRGTCQDNTNDMLVKGRAYFQTSLAQLKLNTSKGVRKALLKDPTIKDRISAGITAAFIKDPLLRKRDYDKRGRRFTSLQIRCIRSLHVLGESHRKLGNDFKTHFTLIGDICRRKSYKHVT